MPTKLLALALFAGTAGAVALYPSPPDPATTVAPLSTLPENPATADTAQIDVVFVLDTTGSMGGLIQAAKDKIWSIASTMAGAQPTPEIRIGLVAYRDRGDEYVTRIVDLSADLDSVHAELMDFQANGGGDGPESVNQALAEAVDDLSWSPSPTAYKAIFLVGDAPPHQDYQDDVDYETSLAEAKARGIVVNAIQCGNHPGTAQEWRHIASLGDGQFFQVGQSGNAIAIATPFDEDLARLSIELDQTRLYYGSDQEKAVGGRKHENAEKLHSRSTPSALARRATFHAGPGGDESLYGEGELIEDLASGKVALDGLDSDSLPQPMQTMTTEAQRQLIEQTTDRRRELEEQIRELADRRRSFLTGEVGSLERADESLDHQLYHALRLQGEEMGLVFSDEGPAY